jgi:membrane protein required for colicin V production
MSTGALIWVDYALLAFLLLSMGLSLLRGLLRELVSFATWLAALWLAYVGMAVGATWFAANIPNPNLALAAGFGVIFLGVLLLGAVANIILGQLLKLSGLGGIDRFLGLAFGFARGVMLWVLLVLLAGLTPLPQEQWWQASVMITKVQPLAETARTWLPAELAQRIRFDPQAQPPSPAVIATPRIATPAPQPGINPAPVPVPTID